MGGGGGNGAVFRLNKKCNLMYDTKEHEIVQY